MHTSDTFVGLKMTDQKPTQAFGSFDVAVR